MAHRHILTIYDGSSECEAVLEMACRLARPHRAQVTVLIVRLVPFTEVLPSPEERANPEVDAIAEKAERSAGRLGVRAACAVRYARSLSAAVISESRLFGVDLVILSVRDPSGLMSAEATQPEVSAILSHTTCAVMLYRPGKWTDIEGK